jgi:NAD-dependent deacetylase
MAFTIPESLIDLLRRSSYVAILTGAGISKESGVPTFRDAQTGLWAKYDPQMLATPEAFQRDPKLVWDWYAWRRSLVSRVKPNPAHFALAQMEQLVPQLALITQNVDGLHARAGNQSVIELHGNIMRVKCFENEHFVTVWEETDEVPRCPQCSSLLRPDVVWFGESLPRDALKTAVSATENCDVFLSIGTSSLVQPAASLPMLALQNNVPTVEVNPVSTPITPHMTFTLAGPAGEVLPELVSKTWPLV